MSTGNPSRIEDIPPPSIGEIRDELHAATTRLILAEKDVLLELGKLAKWNELPPSVVEILAAQDDLLAVVRKVNRKSYRENCRDEVWIRLARSLGRSEKFVELGHVPEALLALRQSSDPADKVILHRVEETQPPVAQA